MILKDGHDIAMTYENLARAVFDCERFGGPHNCAEASVYGNAFVPETNELGRLIMKCIIDRIIDDGNYLEEEIDTLLDIRNRMNNMTDQGEAIETIEELVDFLNDHGY